MSLGWRPHPGGLLLGAAIIALGTATFAAMGLLLGDAARRDRPRRGQPLWFVFAGFGALTLDTATVPEALAWVARLTPSGALTEALSQATASHAMTLSVDWFGIAVLAVWGAVSAGRRAALVPVHLMRRALSRIGR